MKTENGITIISITIYVIVMMLVVSLMAVMTNYFYKNVDYTNIRNQFNMQYTTINNYFSEEANLENNMILEINEITNEETGTKQKWIIFSNKNQYTYIEKNKSLYRNNIKIARDIESFEVTQVVNNRKTRI